MMQLSSCLHVAPQFLDPQLARTGSHRCSPIVSVEAIEKLEEGQLLIEKGLWK